ncbi:MAG: DUF5011 domain-containing protein [Bacteroidales bacterium]|nr:DUF5011 domain-containing protein [Bacteroidales bacterium]MCF8454485.1 DUF5011 domain-containing protein [Bacteroidales bacterium]
MKKKIFSTQSFLLIGILLLSVLYSCKDKDVTAPRASLAGPNPYKITLNQRYHEYGLATLWDNLDDSASLNVTIVHEIDTLEKEFLNVDGDNIKLGVGATIQTGEFTVTYTVKDAAGNKTVLTRSVIVANSLSKFTRQYSVTKTNLSDPLDTYEDYDTDLEAYENLNNRILFANFSNFENVSLSVHADVRGDSIFIPLHTFPPASFSYLIEGKYDETVTNGFAGMVNRSNYGLEITFTASSTGTATQDFHEVYTKY